MIERGLPCIAENLRELNIKFLTCAECASYSVTKQPPVAAYGLNKNGIMIIGQSPGIYGADVTGIPFTKDKSGKLFQCFLKNCKLIFEDCYTTNLMKFCPANEKIDLHPIWLLHSQTHLLDEIEAVKPKLIITFGSLAFRALFPDGSLRIAHGKNAGTIDYGVEQAAQVFPFYHFAYYLRGGADFKGLDEDVDKFKIFLKKYNRQQELNKTEQKGLITYEQI